ncbi:allantoinase [Staphylococcus microti]|uniref:Allantoinase n=1 Tax=Staphylococcus microti TaxID=569857 RepID=A0A0D6XUD0_9STAP|nr:allantoinase AllB [Staphylococcus microti]KIX91856.1 allantoinase [Staphylococcus microti]PNZ84044.1 allantoinase AllB [Staphylococcus microti]SUM56486.1 putative allantoinase [Staphylococcus microti]
MKFDTLIKNGLVILEDEAKEVEVGIKDGKIAEIGTDLGDAAEVIDAKGLIVSPGMIDAHVHITEPGGGYRDDWEGYETGTRGSAKGGVTTIIEMPLNQVPATTDHESIQVKYAAGEGKLAVDVASYGGLVPYNLDGGIQELDEDGVVAYKCFVATCGDRSIDGDFMNVDDYSLYEGMKQIAKTGKILSIHAENAAITDKLGEIAYKNGETTMAAYVDSRPAFTEVEPIQKLILFAKETGCRIHIVHVACEEGVEAIVKAQKEGVDVTCETCTHYLYFYKEELDDIDFVTSDHSPCNPELKDKDNAFEAWGGIAGVQNNVDVLFDEGVQKRDMSLIRFAEIIAKNPAERFDLKEKGSIKEGKDADFVLIKRDAPYTLKAEDLAYRHQISPYVGREIGAQVVRTILRGQTTYEQEKGLLSEFVGQFIKK